MEVKNFAILLLGFFNNVVNGLNIDSMKCKGVDMKMTEEQVTHFKDCNDHMDVHTKEDMTLDKIPCYAKCVFEHKKLVDAAGKPHKEYIQSMLTDAMTHDLKEELMKKLSKCLDDHAAEVEPGDESCASYTPLALCMHTTYMSACH